MLETLMEWDHNLFVLINQHLVHPFLDSFFYFFTNIHQTSFFQFLLLPVVLGAWFWYKRNEALKVLVVLSIMVGITDSLGYRVLKPFWERIRPNNVESLDARQIRSYDPQGYSLPSNHALNTFGMAGVLSYYYPALRGVFYGTGVLIAYSRVYVGVHYPFDVMVGALLGVLLAVVVRWAVLSRWSLLCSSWTPKS